MTRIWLLTTTFILVYSFTLAQWHVPHKQQNSIPQTGELFISDEDLARQRLPRVVNVDKYELTIWPHYPFQGISKQVVDFTFDGTVVIHFTITKDTPSIWLFAQNLLEIKTIDLKYSGTTSLALNYLDVNPNTTRVTITPVETFLQGENYTLKIDYRGPINEYGDAGLYYSSYYNDEGDIKYLVGTFFEPMRARKMFPGFDDPFFKATYQLNVVYPKLAKIYSNTDKRDPDGAGPNDQYRVAQFLETKRFSSYLLAFTIGDFKEALETTKSGIKVRTVSMPYLEPYLNISAKVGANCVDAMEGLVNVPYPWGKLDNIEMIEMGHSSAMENVGLIVYTRFLSQLPIATPAQYKLSQSIIMCHEISHQWFGDLVTADRWGYEFLHESFAAFFQNRANQKIYENDAEQVEFIENIMVTSKDAALYVQANGSHAVVADQAYFDDITYASGGAILRMFERVLGSDDFFKALNSFLTNHQYGNADDNDLIVEFENVKNNQNLCGNLQLRTVMADFLRNRYHPIVGVYIENGYYAFNQESSNPEKGGVWSIPVFALNLNTGEEKLGYILPQGKTCPENWLSATDPYILNSKSTSFARFRYDQNIWDNILSANLTNVDDSTLLGLVTDAIQWETEKYYPIYYWQSPRLFTKIVNAKGGKIAPHIVEAILAKFLAVQTFFLKGDAHDLYHLTLSNGLSPIYQTLKWDASDWKNGHLNSKVLPIAVKLDLGDARKQGRDLFTQFTNDCKDMKKLESCNKIQADSRTAAYCAGVIDNNQNAIEFLHNYWTELIRDGHTYFYFQYELESVVNGLACITKAQAIQDLLDVALENNQANYIDALAYNVDAADALYDYIPKNVARFLTHQPLLENALNSMISTWHTTSDLKRLVDLAGRIQNRFPKRTQQYFTNAINQLTQNIADAQRVVPQFTRWMWDNEVVIGKPVWPQKLTNVNAKNINYRLVFEPHYPVDGYPNDPMTDFTFHGHATITYTTTRATNKITLNSHRQLIDDIQVSYNGGANIVTVQMDRDYDNGILTLNLGSQIPTNVDVTIDINYIGLLINKAETKQVGVIITGFWNAKTRQQDTILFTELAGGTNPRSLIPCFDEPSYKATWEVIVIHPSILTALSNGAIDNQKPSQTKSGYTVTTFTKTKLMSSYLLAIAIGKFASISGITSLGAPIRVWAPTGYETYGQVALQAATDTINFLSDRMAENYTDFNSKLDILAVPDHGGAMENWGMIISNINYALYDPQVHKLEDKQQVYAVISHETIHHWFGDLVTTKDWDTTFVSEGFATFFEPVIWDNFKTFGEKIRFIASEDALRFDERFQAKIIPDSVTEGYQPFSPIVYAKPASVLHTLVVATGIDNFKKGLQSYIKDLKFKNAQDTDLWQRIGLVAQSNGITGWDGKPLDVKKFMDPFFKQVSYPILTVDQKKDKYVRVRQSSYYDPSTLPKSRYNYMWYLPISWRVTNDFNYTQWVTDGETSNNVPLSSAAYLNYRRDTYARVKYSDDVWAEILKGLKRPKYYNETFRAAVITDTYSLVNAGQLSWTRMLDLLQTLKNDHNEIPWRYGAEILEELVSRLKMTDSFEDLKSLITDIIANRGSRSETDGWNYLNANIPIARLASRLLIGNFTTLAKEFMDSVGRQCLNSTYGVDECIGVVLSPESRGPYLCAGIQTADDDTKKRYSEVLDVIVDFSINDLFIRAKADPYIEAASCQQDDVSIGRYLSNIYNGFYFSFAKTFLQRIAQNDFTGTAIYDWLIKKTYRIEFLQESYIFEDFVMTMVRDWNRQDLLDQFNSIPWEALSSRQQQVINRAAKKIQSNIDWQTQNYGAISTWLTKNY